ncbi:MAG: hypothetical protein DRG87_07060 [Deltaproteobacteria bacterium]|nr:hypothetical protein [Deltaproteobacteria bacterium]RLB29489.1 MAG: hypothetical protein DRG87_07060 [Deltaproteobacteria bacterium]
MLHLFNMHQFCTVLYLGFDVILGVPGEPLDGTVALSMGTAMPKGCGDNSEAMLKNVGLPIEISTVRLTKDLLNNGCQRDLDNGNNREGVNGCLIWYLSFQWMISGAG